MLFKPPDKDAFALAVLQLPRKRASALRCMTWLGGSDIGTETLAATGSGPAGGSPGPYRET